MARFDHSGQQYGSMLVLRPASDDMRSWHVRCEQCGRERVAPTQSLSAAKCQPPMYCNKCKPVRHDISRFRRAPESASDERQDSGGLVWNGEHWASTEVGLLQQRFYLGMMTT